MFHSNRSRSVHLTDKTVAADCALSFTAKTRKDSIEDATVQILATNQVYNMKAYQTTGFTDNKQEKKSGLSNKCDYGKLQCSAKV